MNFWDEIILAYKPLDFMTEGEIDFEKVDNLLKDDRNNNGNISHQILYRLIIDYMSDKASKVKCEKRNDYRRNCTYRDCVSCDYVRKELVQSAESVVMCFRQIFENGLDLSQNDYREGAILLVGLTCSGLGEYMLPAARLFLDHGARSVRCVEDSDETPLTILKQHAGVLHYNERHYYDDENREKLYDMILESEQKHNKGVHFFIIRGHREWDHDGDEWIGIYDDPKEMQNRYLVEKDRLDQEQKEENERAEAFKKTGGLKALRFDLGEIMVSAFDEVSGQWISNVNVIDPYNGILENRIAMQRKVEEL